MAWTPRRRRLLGGLLALLGTYALLGFLVLPAILKAQLPRRLSLLLNRTVTLERVRTNPFTLSATLDGFRILDRDGQALLGWDRLYVNVDASTLFTRTLSFKAIHLAGPYGRVVLDQDGRLNCADLLEPRSPQPAAPGPPRPLRVGTLRIDGARVQLVDRSQGEPFATTLGPLSFALDGFATSGGVRSPYAFEGRTEAGERFSWQGSLVAEPLQAQGHFRVEQLALRKYRPYYLDQVNFQIREGLASLGASYTFAWAPGSHVLKFQDGSLDVTGLSLAQAGVAAPAVTLPVLAMRGVDADLLGRSVRVGSLRLRDGRLQLVRLKDGTLDLQQLFTPKPQPPPKVPAQPWSFTLAEFGLQGFQAGFEDRVPPRTVRAAIQGLDLTLKDLSLDPKGTATLALAMTLNGSASLSASGAITPFAPGADLQVKLQGLALAPFDPYLEPALNARVNRGTAALDGRVRFTGGSRPVLAFKGQAGVDHLEVMDGLRSEPFIRYRGLRLKGLDLTTEPRQFSLQEAELLGHEYRLVIAEDGTSNVARALKLEAPPTALGGALASALPATPAPAWQMNIHKVTMRQGQLAFIDRSVAPPAQLLLTDLEGTNTGLSSNRDEPAQLTLRGLAGGLGPILIQGRAMPLRHDQDTDLSVRITGANLTDFSPYAGKYLGYTIREGRLDVEARVRIQQRKLVVEDRTRMDRFYLGDRVESKDATKLPVRLGLALLRDRKGLIELDVPVDGSLDDPDIHYGRMVWKAILNALGKVVASPFTLLSKLVGSGADLSSANFPAGASALDPPEAAKVDTLAKALQDRPELRLEVEGTVDAQADGAVLRKAALEQLLRRTRAEAGQEREEAPQAPLSGPERERWVRAAHDRAYPVPKGIKPVPMTLAEREQQLLTTLTVPPEALTALADGRTRAAIARLLQGNQVEADRIFVVQGSEAAKAGGSRVTFTLR
jgi:hypothetical protein